jgi:hypothetical protein
MRGIEIGNFGGEFRSGLTVSGSGETYPAHHQTGKDSVESYPVADWQGNHSTLASPCAYTKSRPSFRGRRSWQPRPVPVFVAVRAQVRVTLQAAPTAMTRNGRDLGDRSAHFKQARNSLMPQIVEMQIRDFQDLAGAGKAGADRVCGERENFSARARH